MPDSQSLSDLRALIDAGRVKCLCGRKATGTTPGGEPECDDLSCHAAEEVERLRGALEDKQRRLEPDGCGGFRWEAADLEAERDNLRRLLADVEPFIGWLAQVDDLKARVRAALSPASDEEQA